MNMSIIVADMGGKTKRAMLRLAGLIGRVGVSDSYVVSD